MTMSTSTAGMVDLAVLAAWAVGALVALRVARQRALAIEQSSEAVSEKVHRLQRLMLVCVGWMFVSYLLIGVLGGISAAVAHHSRSPHHTSPVAVIVVVALFALVVVPEIVALRAVRASLVRVRDISTRVPNRRRRVIASVSLMVCYAALIAVGLALVPRHGAGHAIGFLVVYLVAVVVLVSVLAPLLLVRLMTTPMSDSMAEPLRRLAAKMGVRVHGFRTMATRGQKAANAMQVGTLPGLRYVIVTDYLSDHLDSDQLAAVVAHELGHARRHHLFRKLAVTFGTWAVAEALLIGLGHAAGASALVKVLIPVLAILIPVSVIVMQGIVGIRFEREADDIAARCVGRGELAGALRCLGELNDTKQDTGRAWSILTQHPGLQQRLDRLTARPANSHMADADR